MGLLSIHSLTVSVDFGDKVYGKGNGRFMSVSAKVPDNSPGIPLDQSGEVMVDGVEMYLTAWQTLMQTRYASGEIDGNEYKRQTAAFLVRIEKIRALYHKIKDIPVDELEAFLKRSTEESKCQNEHS